VGSKENSIQIDGQLLDAAQKALGTATARETVELALHELLRTRARAAEVVALATMEDLDLADPEIMARAWRS